jgi:hypothetical protein
MNPLPGRTENDASEPSIAVLIGQVVADAEALMRGEVALAKAEIREEIGHARAGAASLASGGLMLAVGVIMLVIMLAHVLTDLMGIAPWGSYLILGGVLTVVGGLMLRRAQKHVSRIDPVPHETIDNVRKDLEWIRQQTPSART